jgi:uncharacterized protein YjiS (DUF1127 family)
MSRSSDLKPHPDGCRSKVDLNPLPRLAHALETWLLRWDRRRELGPLDDEQLKDVGISRADAAREARKPFWRS